MLTVSRNSSSPTCRRCGIPALSGDTGPSLTTERHPNSVMRGASVSQSTVSPTKSPAEGGDFTLVSMNDTCHLR
jgi:hypothetical protein